MSSSVVNLWMCVYKTEICFVYSAIYPIKLDRILYLFKLLSPMFNVTKLCAATSFEITEFLGVKLEHKKHYFTHKKTLNNTQSIYCHHYQGNKKITV